MAHESYQHRPVLLNEALDTLAIQSDGIYIDATFGRGGHSQAILERLSPKGRLLAIDQDESAEVCAKELFANEPRFTFTRCRFDEIRKVCEANDCMHRVNGVLFDLGVSSPQLDDPARGFSFMRDGPLDMRMDRRQELDAKTWLEQVEERELASVIKTFGEERFAKRIANAIVKRRKEAPLETTGNLARLIEQTVPKRELHKHPATRTFQAIRMFINDELAVLEKALQEAFDVLSSHGRLVVISFHSLEDRLVKQFMKKLSNLHALPARLPVKRDKAELSFKVVAKKIRATRYECDTNPRARSAILRGGEKL